MNTAQVCKCGVSFVMVQHHRTGKFAPIEVQPSADGNILVTDTGVSALYEVVPAKERAGLIQRGHQLRKNHFASCPNAIQFRPPPHSDKEQTPP